MKLKNTNPLGSIDLPLIGKTLEAGEVFEVPDDVGSALLDQTGNYALADATPVDAPPADVAPVKESTP